MNISLAEDDEDLLKTKSLCQDLFLQIINVVGREEGNVIKQNIESYVDASMYDIRNRLYNAGVISDRSDDAYDVVVQYIRDLLYSLDPADAAWRGNNSSNNIRGSLSDLSDLIDFG